MMLENSGVVKVTFKGGRAGWHHRIVENMQTKGVGGHAGDIILGCRNK